MTFPKYFLTLIVSVVTILLVTHSENALAQGQDSTPAERDIMIIGELLPGTYNNANQAYFDVRLKRPENTRHDNMHAVITRLKAPKMGDYVFSVAHYINAASPPDLDNPDTSWLYVFSVDNTAEAVRMKTYKTDKLAQDTTRNIPANYAEKCDLLWRQEAGQFHGRLEDTACDLNDEAGADAYDIFLSADAFWLQAGRSDLTHMTMDRARDFDCYIDVPGVGGGRDIPYKRYPMDRIHDLGGETWITTDQGETLGLSLFRVMWTFNNYEGVFARPSFVIYVKKKTEEGKTQEISYSWTSSDAERIGINLKWMLGYCYQLSNETITPFYKTKEPKVAR